MSLSFGLYLTLFRVCIKLLDDDYYQEKMHCVNCRKPMVVLELAGVEVDFCSVCGGIWLDAGELGLLAQGSGDAEESLLPDFAEWRVERSSRKCPICRRRMDRIASPDCGSITLDRCRRSHGIWFDRGELGTILRSFQDADKPSVAALLKEVFYDSLK